MLQRIRLKNYCQFEDREFTFSPGLNCVRGRNGAGKSNLLRAIRFALTGSVPGRKQTDLIRNTADPVMDSGVELTLETADGPVTIERYLRPKRVAAYCGEMEINGHKSVEEFLVKALGIPDISVLENVFINQREMDAFIDLPETARLNHMMELFGSNRVRAIWEELGTYLSSYRSLVTLSNLMAEAREAIEQNKELLEEAEQALVEARESYQKFFGEEFISRTIAEIDKLHGQLTTLSKIASTEEYAKSIENQIADYQKKIDELSVRKKDLKDRLSALDSQETIRAKIHELNQKKSALTAYASYLAKYQAFQKTVAVPVLEKFRQRPALRSINVSQQDLDVLQDGLMALRSRRDILGHSLEMHAMLSPGKHCPLCNQVIPPSFDSSSQKSALEKELAEVAAMISDLEGCLEEAKRLMQQIQQNKQIRRKIRQEIQAARMKRPQFHAERGHLPKESLQEIEHQIALLLEREKEYSKIFTELTQCEAAEKEAQNRLQALRTQLDYLRNAAHTMRSSVSGVDEGTIRRELEQKRMALEQAQESRINLENLENRVESRRKMLEFHQKQYADLQREAARRKKLEDLRDIFHPSGAIAIYIDHCIQEQEEIVNNVLESFGARFTVSYDRPCFMATFPDGRTVPDTFLSVGERLMLAFGWHLALRSTTFGLPSLFCLDEPAAGLDEDHLRMLPEILAKVSEFARQRDIQVLFVTHDNLDESLFSNVIVIE